MDNAFFRKEIAEYIEGCYSEFETYQNITKEILDLFHSICEKYNIEYVLYFGSLLGAVRDSSTVPWDYDVDVLVPVTQRDELIKILKKELGTEFYYSYIDNTKNYPTSCLRVCKKGFPHTAIHVDVFFLIGCPSDDKQRVKFVNKIKKASRYREIKYGPEWFKSKKSGVLNNIVNNLVKIRSALIPRALCDKEFTLSQKYPLSECVYCMVCGDLINTRILKHEWFSERKLINVDSKNRYVPIGYEQILQDKFKNYHEYPSIKSRFEEFYKELYIIKERTMSHSSIE